MVERTGPTREALAEELVETLEALWTLEEKGKATLDDIRRLAATKRVGHGGTLDPFASGVLPIFLGHGTRMVEYHLGDRKAYRATVCFGASSSTDDLEGELTPNGGVAPTRDAGFPLSRE